MTEKNEVNSVKKRPKTNGERKFSSYFGQMTEMSHRQFSLFMHPDQAQNTSTNNPDPFINSTNNPDPFINFFSQEKHGQVF